MNGSFKAFRKNGIMYFRSSITYHGKHISLGSYKEEKDAQKAYIEAEEVLYSDISPEDYPSSYILLFEKYITLINFRDNNVYIKNPVYLFKRFFLYYCDQETVFKFDTDDLFFYSSHHISRRGDHFFVADYGMQINLNSRYGIRRHAVLGRDYRFINGDRYDYRYENIDIINRYFGVEKILLKGKQKFKTRILLKGKFVIGIYDSEIEAAIAYNKAADLITRRLPGKKYDLNYIDSISPYEYANIYTDITISDRFLSALQGDLPR